MKAVLLPEEEYPETVDNVRLLYMGCRKITLNKNLELNTTIHTSVNTVLEVKTDGCFCIIYLHTFYIETLIDEITI